MGDRAKRAAKTTKDRAAAQQQRKERQTHRRLKNRERSGCRGCASLIVREWLTVETEEQREARLQRMRASQSDRLAAEIEDRGARLQRMRANQSKRLAEEQR